MAAGIYKLTVASIKAAAPGKLQDGGGLVLKKSDSGGQWIFRYSLLGRRREMGPGSWPALSLAEARRSRDKWAALIEQEIDPVDQRNREAEAARAELDKRDPTLAEAVAEVFEAKKPSLRRDGVGGRWLSPLVTHILPKIGGRKITSLHQSDIRDC